MAPNLDTFSFHMNFVLLLCIIVTCAMVGVLTSGITHTLRLAKYCVCPRYPDDVSFWKLLLFYVQLITFWSNIYLLYALYWMTKTYWFNPFYLSCTILLFLVLFTVSLSNFLFVYKWLMHWFYRHSNPFAARWLFETQTYHWFYALLMISGSVYHTICIVNCKLFGVPRSNMGLSTWELYKICRHKRIIYLFYGYSLSMLVIEGTVCLFVPAVYIINMVSTASTVLSMMIFCISLYYKHNDRYLEMHNGSEIVYFQLSMECTDHHNDDEDKLMKTKEMRCKWTQCIKEETELLHSVDVNNERLKLEVVSVVDSKNPNDQKFTVYGVLLDLDSYWIHLIQDCVDDQNAIAKKIKNEFELETLPSVLLITNENETVDIMPAAPYKLSKHFLINSIEP
eukprot:30146_1